MHRIQLVPYVCQCSKPETKKMHSPTKLEVPMVQSASAAVQQNYTIQHVRKCKHYLLIGDC